MRYETPLSSAFARGTLSTFPKEKLAEWSMWVMGKGMYVMRMLSLTDDESYNLLAGPEMMSVVRLIANEGYSIKADTVSIIRFDCWEERMPNYYVSPDMMSLIFSSGNRGFAVFFDGGYSQEACTAIERALSGYALSTPQARDIFFSLATYGSAYDIAIAYDEGTKRIRFELVEKGAYIAARKMYDRTLSRAALLDTRLPLLRSLGEIKVRSSVIDNLGRLRVFTQDEVTMDKLEPFSMSATELSRKSNLPVSFTQLKTHLGDLGAAILKEASKEWKRAPQKKETLPEGEGTELARLVLFDLHAEAAALEGKSPTPYESRETIGIVVEDGERYA